MKRYCENVKTNKFTIAQTHAYNKERKREREREREKKKTNWTYEIIIFNKMLLYILSLTI